MSQLEYPKKVWWGDLHAFPMLSSSTLWRLLCSVLWTLSSYSHAMELNYFCPRFQVKYHYSSITTIGVSSTMETTANARYIISVITQNIVVKTVPFALFILPNNVEETVFCVGEFLLLFEADSINKIWN